VTNRCGIARSQVSGSVLCVTHATLEYTSAILERVPEVEGAEVMTTYICLLNVPIN
jgi:hypothetical protein